MSARGLAHTKRPDVPFICFWEIVGEEAEIDALKKVVCDYVFFFSSRRRHTRLQGDWSSDVCSSDLRNRRLLEEIQVQLSQSENIIVPWGVAHMPGIAKEIQRFGFRLEKTQEHVAIQIGRASCRERV